MKTILILLQTYIAGCQKHTRIQVQFLLRHGFWSFKISVCSGRTFLALQINQDKNVTTSVPWENNTVGEIKRILSEKKMWGPKKKRPIRIIYDRAKTIYKFLYGGIFRYIFRWSYICVNVLVSNISLTRINKNYMRFNLIKALR